MEAATREGAPKQVIILAAGRALRLQPYTDLVPTALISIADRPMVAHLIDALRRQGVTKFIICRGWQGGAFDKHSSEFGDGIVFVDCPRYASTGMLESLRSAVPYLDDGGFYITYADIIFRPSVARQLCEARGDISVVVNVAAPGNQSKGPADVEVVTTMGEGSSRIVRRIGKHRRVRDDEAVGEFAGLVKVVGAGRVALNKAFDRLWGEKNSSTGECASSNLPWWLEPVQDAHLCDLLQLLADDGTAVTPTMVFGGWHEVNTCQDLIRAQNDTAMFLSQEEVRTQVAAMGACLLSEANDLKRPLPIVAKELNVDFSKLESLLRGDLEVNDALDVLRKMSEVYPVSLNDLWLDADDTSDGVRLFTADASEASARVLSRSSASGEQRPYYEYRDAAMSRCSQFRPEWIKMLRYVSSGDPQDPDVQLNKGHLMMQTTLFIGPVDFYYKDQHGTVHRREMNTGDSNYISPFVPHSFTARSEDQEAVIIAVTYGGNVRRAFTEFARIGSKHVFTLAGDRRDPVLARQCTLKRYLDAECMTVEDLTAAVSGRLSAQRVRELLQGQEAAHSETEVLAQALGVRVSDLFVCPLEEHEEVVVARAGDSQQAARKLTSYRLAPLARTRHQPDLKTFDLEVLDSATPGEPLRCGLHTFLYHFGSEAVELSWQGRGGRSHSAVLRPGGSAYVAPMVSHSFSVRPPGIDGDDERTLPACARGRRIFLVRIPGHLTGETLAEFATFSGFGRARVGAETERWYD